MAGVIAGTGANGVGGLGGAFGCRFLALKVLTGIYEAPTSKLATALRYAAGLDAMGRSVWRGADVMNISVRFDTGAVVDSALRDAATKGRNGKGCPIFCSAGNSASGWLLMRATIETEGEHTLRWEFQKDSSDIYNRRSDTVWIDAVKFPDGAIESFEGAGLPPGWKTGGSARWSRVQAGLNGDHAFTGLDGPRGHALRAGKIGDNQTTWLELTTNLTAGPVSFRFWISSEGSPSRLYDPLRFYVDGEERLAIAGQYSVLVGVGYPASHPAVIAVGASTDQDYRADYSQYAAKLDFLAPSSGGRAGIFTTDRSGYDGYNSGALTDGDYYPDFGGTSAASPLAAAIGALVLSVNPALTVGDVRKILRTTCDKIGGVTYDAAGRHASYGSGRLNAGRAVRAAQADVGLSVALTPAIANDGCPTTFILTVTNQGAAPAYGVMLTNQLPADVLFVAAKPAPSFRAGNLLAFAITNLNPRTSTTIRITVTNPGFGTYSNFASVSLPVVDWKPGDNIAVTEVFVWPTPAISIGDAFVLEGNAGVTNALFTVSLSNPSGKTVTVRYATATNTALSTTDFFSTNGTLTFKPGQTEKSIAVRARGDLRDEPDETFFVNLSQPVNASLDRAQGVGTILDNDPPPALSISDVTVTEGNTGAGRAVFAVRLAAVSGRPVTVAYATLANTATEGIDFIAIRSLLTFAPGVVLQTITVTIPGDIIRESNETFFVNLLDPTNATLARAQARGTIVNNDALPRLFIADATVTEGDDGRTNAMFAMRLTPASGLPVTVNYFTANGSAIGGRDFAPAFDTLFFAPGDTNQFIPVATLGNTLYESNRAFRVGLFSPSNAALGRAIAVGTIVDNDPPPALRIEDVAFVGAARHHEFRKMPVTLSTVSGKPVTVRYSTAAGTAVVGTDFAAAAGLLIFPPGVTTQQFNLVVSPTTVVDAPIEFFINLTNPVNATLDRTQATVQITGVSPLAGVPPGIGGGGTLAPPAAVILEGRMDAGTSLEAVFRLRFKTAVGSRYRVERCEGSLRADGWQPWPGAENVTGTGAVVEVTDPAPATRPQCFYRLRLLSP